MITTVTLNPAVDQTIIVDQYQLGQIHRVKVRRMDVGGKGINVSKVIRLFDGKTTAIGYLGEENKQFFEQFFHQYDINNDFVLVDGTTRTNTKIIDLRNQQTTEFNELGFYISQKEINQLKEKIRRYEQKSKYIIFSGSMCQGSYSGLFEEYINQVENSHKLVIDATGEMLLEGVKKSPFLIKPNIYEFKTTFGLSVSSKEDLIRKTLGIREKFNIQWILLSMGAEGALLLSENCVLEADAVPVNVKSTVGAGDSMLGGFIYGYENWKDPVEALRYAVACGTMAVTKEGTELFTKEEALALFPKIKIKNITSHYGSSKICTLKI